MIACLAGFLGVENDFCFLSKEHFVLPILKDEKFLRPFSQIGKVILESVPSSCTNIIGFSMGGRILLHTLIQYPDRFKKAVIIAGHTGLTSKEAKQRRLDQDKEWIRKFSTQSFDDCMKEWNEQEVLSSFLLKRDEHDYNLESLVHALSKWSLGVQEDLISNLEKINTEILWIVGEKDTKFLKIASEATHHIKSCRLEVVFGANHRVMWEKSTEVRRIIEEFFE